MAGMDAQTYAPQSTKRKFPFGQQNQWKRGKGPNRQPLQHSDEIVYTDGKTLKITPSLSSQLRELTDACVIGLQYVWEYRSPSKSVPPHYLCKLCHVTQLQPHIIQHLKGWKHAVRYLKKIQPDSVPQEEEEISKNQELKKSYRAIAMEVEKTEGRGQLKVILKEPGEVQAFSKLHSAIPAPAPHSAPAIPFGMNFSRDDFRAEGFGGYPSLQAPPDYTLDQDHYQEMGHTQRTDEYEAGDYDGYGPPGDYVTEYRDGHMQRPMERSLQRPMNTPTMSQPLRQGNSNGGDISGTLLSYLDTFKIENESDAQLVLKVTQKLTDVLMEYRLRRVEGPTVPSVFPPQPPTNPKYNEYSGYQGVSRYAPTRYYN